MAAEIINGKDLAQELRMSLKDEVTELKQKGINPHLTVVLVGDNP
ncbi:tetrahydrofolate dehydrogenase, partial [Bacillus obstructivus]